ncbi:hypothetical protein B7494_g2246 [Chlorociboria aeruginascens]|nr:hypothetical protein B7494_g2246 [Chlorociboria aeruginascens]
MYYGIHSSATNGPCLSAAAVAFIGAAITITKEVLALATSLSEHRRMTNLVNHLGIRRINHQLHNAEETTSHLVAVSRSAQSSVEEIQKSMITTGTIESLQKSFATIDQSIRELTGSGTILDEMKEELMETPNEARRMKAFALHGMPGVGKTQIALRDGKLAQGFADIAKVLNLERGVVSADQLRVLLFVLDNVDDLSTVNPYWPPGICGAVVITSQNPACEYTLAQTCAHVLPFSPEEGDELFQTRLSDNLSELDKQAAVQISNILGYHPFAIDQMASFVLESKCSVLDLKAMHTDRQEALELQNVNSLSIWYNHTIAATFVLAIDKLNDVAQGTIEILSFFDLDKIPETLLWDTKREIRFLANTVQRCAVIEDLRAFSLINKNEEDSSISLHCLVRDAATRHLIQQEHVQAAFDKAVYLLRNTFPLHGLSRDHMVEVRDQCEGYQPHVLALHAKIVEMSGNVPLMAAFDFVKPIYSCAWYFCERGRFDSSSPLIDTAAAGYEHHNETAKVEILIDLATRALDIREAAVKTGLLDCHHPNRANSFMNLGVMVARNDPKKAIQPHQTALSIREEMKKYSQDQLHGLALNFLNIGRCWWMVRELELAAQSFEKCLEILKDREKVVGFRFPLAWALQALGNVRTDQGRLEEAFLLHTQSMELLQESLGPFHLKTGKQPYEEDNEASYDELIAYFYR